MVHVKEMVHAKAMENVNVIMDMMVKNVMDVPLGSMNHSRMNLHYFAHNVTLHVSQHAKVLDLATVINAARGGSKRAMRDVST